MKGIGEALAVCVAAGVFCLASFRIGMGYGQLSVCEVNLPRFSGQATFTQKPPTVKCAVMQALVVFN